MAINNLCNHCVQFLEGKISHSKNHFGKTYAKYNTINSKKPIGAFIWSDCASCYDMIGKDGWFVQTRKIPKNAA